MSEENFGVFSDVEMGRALYNGLPDLNDEWQARNNYSELKATETPDVLVLNGSPNKEVAGERAREVITNAWNFDEGIGSYDILVPEEEYEWHAETLESARKEIDSLKDIYLSEDQIGYKLDTAIDDAIAADKFSQEGDTVFYHTTGAHGMAVNSAAETVHNDSRNHYTFSKGKDDWKEVLKQGVNAGLQSHWFPRKREF